MNFEDCIKFANENPASYIATMDGAQPRVRGVAYVVRRRNRVLLSHGNYETHLQAAAG